MRGVSRVPSLPCPGELHSHKGCQTRAPTSPGLLQSLGLAEEGTRGRESTGVGGQKPWRWREGTGHLYGTACPPQPRPLGTAGVRNPVDVSFPLLGMGGPRHRVHFRPPAKPSGSWPLYGSPNRCWTGAPDSAFLLLSCAGHVCGESARPRPRGHEGDAEESDKLFCPSPLLLWDSGWRPAPRCRDTHRSPLKCGATENPRRKFPQGRRPGAPAECAPALPAWSPEPEQAGLCKAHAAFVPWTLRATDCPHLAAP